MTSAVWFYVSQDVLSEIPRRGARVDGGLLCPLHLQGETGPAGGGRVATVVSGDGAAGLRLSSDSCRSGEGPSPLYAFV